MGGGNVGIAFGVNQDATGGMYVTITANAGVVAAQVSIPFNQVTAFCQQMKDIKAEAERTASGLQVVGNNASIVDVNGRKLA